VSGEPIGAAEPEIVATGKRVVVIGGGDTGADCVGTSWRQGAESVLQLEILAEPPPTRSPQTPWPMWPLMRRDSSSHKEGGERRWSVMTEAFLGEGGHVRRLRCARVEWVAREGGRAAPRKKLGTEFETPADLVLLSMGFVGPGRNRLVEELGIEMDSGRFVKRDACGMTSHPGIFVAGDMSQGASLVVRAMQDGKHVAGGIAAYLRAREGGAPAKPE
jgi:glutamate synthase (NADPH/NADH) small chain